jgi:hypothetical protein
MADISKAQIPSDSLLGGDLKLTLGRWFDKNLGLKIKANMIKLNPT